MYPIPANRSLTLHEIADHWSRKIKPKRSKRELLDDLARAWWRGEFQSSKGFTRLKALKIVFKTRPAEIPFWIKGRERPQTVWPQPDGGAEVLITSVIPVPSDNSDTWSDEECEAAYKAVAEDWGNDVYSIVEPIVAGVTLSEPEFTSWTLQMGYKRPKFWAASPLVVAEVPKPSKEALPKNRPGNHRKFVQQYIAAQKASGVRPTKAGLEKAAKSNGIRGGRPERRFEFDRQMGADAPVRGRPTNKSPV